MKIHLFPKEIRNDPLMNSSPRLCLFIGRYCYESCYGRECKLKKHNYSKVIVRLTSLLYKYGIVLITKDPGQYSGTKYCPHKLDTIKKCDNCKFAAGYDENYKGLCSSKDHRNMTPEEHREDMDNDEMVFNRCRFWEPGRNYPGPKRKKDDIL